MTHKTRDMDTSTSAFLFFSPPLSFLFFPPPLLCHPAICVPGLSAVQTRYRSRSKYLGVRRRNFYGEEGRVAGFFFFFPSFFPVEQDDMGTRGQQI